MLTLNVKSVTAKDNRGTSFSPAKLMGFQELNIEQLESANANTDAQFTYLDKTYIVDETLAIVAAAIGISKGGLSYAMGIIDYADVAQRTLGTKDMKDALGNNVIIPKGAVILDGLLLVKTLFTSGTNTGQVALGVETDAATGLKAAAVVTSFTAAAKQALIPVGSAATAILPLTADRKLQFVNTVEAITGGKAVCLVMYALDPTAV